MAPRRIRLLYLMHADWRSVWQRSQALAVRLQALPDLELFVLYVPTWRRWQVRRRAERPMPRVPLPHLPFSRRSAIVTRMNRWLMGAAIWVVGKAWRPNAVLVPYPEMYAALPGGLRALPLIYDCMDVASGFTSDAGKKRELEAAERELVERASAVMVSSAYLGRSIAQLMGDGRQPRLVRNGFDPRAWMRASAPETTGAGSPTRLGYFGMVSTWFDQQLVRQCLEHFDDLEIHVWGPNDTPLFEHDRFVTHGMVEHGDLARETAHVDAFLMPFVVTELIEGVDPVKLYEYISLGKPAISVYYEELEHFRGLVHFYRSADELFAFIEALKAGTANLAPDPSRAKAFLADASWDRRAEAVAEVIRAAVAGRSTPLTS